MRVPTFKILFAAGLSTTMLISTLALGQQRNGQHIYPQIPSRPQVPQLQGSYPVPQQGYYPAPQQGYYPAPQQAYYVPPQQPNYPPMGNNCVAPQGWGVLGQLFPVGTQCTVTDAAGNTYFGNVQ
jgi:hypothetical protein